MEGLQLINEKQQNNLQSLEDIEIKLLIDAIFYRYGYDFRNYAYASQKRRLRDILYKYNYNFYADLQNAILHDSKIFDKVLSDLTITVTEVFRDPEFYLVIRRNLIEELKTYPKIKIWHAGCATGEEVYSLAILLKEEGLYDKAMIYATDINPKALEASEKGVFSLETFKKGSQQYFQSGGKYSLSDYYIANEKGVRIKEDLKKNITFADHNLVTDHKFGEMQLILCRNVLIYFNRELQNRALELMDQSLDYGGFLVIGTKESLTFSSIVKNYSTFAEKEKIYRKKWQI